jgi:YlmC/YmxH family sporulation protein
MRLSEIQHKDIVNINDGRKIGNIIDVRIDEKGLVAALVVEPAKGIFKVFNAKDKEVEVYWNNIVKIGEDVILVKVEL